MKLKVSTCIALANAITALDLGYQKATRLANGETTVANLPFNFDFQLRWNLSKNLRKLKAIKEDRDNAVNGKLRELSKGTNLLTPADHPKEIREFNVTVREADDHEEDVQGLLKLRLTALRGKDEAAPNPIPEIILEALTPLIVDDLPEPAKEDMFE